MTANGYWDYWKVSSLYNTDRTAYFQKMDAMISAAAQNDIGVVLGIFWGIHPPPGEMFMASTVPGMASSLTTSIIGPTTEAVTLTLPRSTSTNTTFPIRTRSTCWACITTPMPIPVSEPTGP